jgi:hypothetical protein
MPRDGLTSAGLALGEAVLMTTVNLARIGRFPARQNGLHPGDRGLVYEARSQESEDRSLTLAAGSAARDFRRDLPTLPE